MPSIFEKPSLLGFRAEGGRVQIPRNQYSSIPAQDAGRYTQAAGEDWVDIAGDDPRYAALLRAAESGDITGMFNPTQWGQLSSSVGFMPGFPQGYASPGERIKGDRAAMGRLAQLGLIEKVQDISQPGAPVPTFRVRKSFLEGTDGPPADMSSMFVGPPAALADATLPARPTAPAATPPSAPAPSMFNTPSVETFASMFPNTGLGLALDAPVSNAPSSAPAPAAVAAPTGTRAERVKAAMESGDFAEKQRQYNQEAMRMGHPSMMDDQGNIVGRELTQEEQMRDAFMRTGGNTPFLQTNDPMQRALQNEMMKQARGQIAANTFGFTPEERRANLEEEVNARKILATPLDSGVREVAPGVRGAFRNGQAVGFATNQAPPRGPNGESTATMNDPLKKYITNPDGSVSLNPNPPQIRLADEMKDTLGRQKIEGKTGGSPMERGLIAAMAAEEARKKKLASDAAAAAVAAAAIPPTPAAPEPGFRTSPTTFGVTPQGLPVDTPQAASTNARAQSPFLPKPKR